MGRNASDNSEGKEVSDVVEKRASDGSEGSEAIEGWQPLNEANGKYLLRADKIEYISPFQIFNI